MATGTGKPHVTRTYAPLHFSDLGPGRFEDLVRQLAYAFRRWRYLDATGVGGSDEGTDIRGIEIVSATASDVDEPEADVEEPPQESFEREWRIQCKRHKVLGPAKAKEIARELIPDETKPPYGSILVAPIDLSAKAIAAFRSEALARGCREAHVWGRASLEDRLFLVENEHLLFAYFGITPRLRQQSRLQDLRRAISIKRRLLSALQLTSIDLAHNSGSNLLVRNIDDDSYPDTELKDEELDVSSPWHLAEVYEFHPAALLVKTREYLGRRLVDGTWDFLSSTAECPGEVARERRTRHAFRQTDELANEVPNRFELAQLIPEDERITVQEIRGIPYTSILEVDRTGDSEYPCPHLFCRFPTDEGPYGQWVEYIGRGRWASDWLDGNDRQELFVTGWEDLLRARAEEEPKI